MNIFVFGGNRFVGKALAERLLKDNKVKKNKLPPLSKVKTYILPLTKDKKK